MTLLKIALIGHPVLRTPARPLEPGELAEPRWQHFIDDLIETMRDANGAGLAANQVHTPVRICTIEVRPDNPRYPYKPPIPLTVLVNPIIEPLGDAEFDNYEGCLSVPNLRGIVRRHRHVRLRFLDRHGEVHERELTGLTAGTVQHECDHLDGKLFVDRVANPASLATWDHFKRYHEEGFVAGLRAQGLIPA